VKLVPTLTLPSSSNPAVADHLNEEEQSRYSKVTSDAPPASGVVDSYLMHWLNNVGVNHGVARESRRHLRRPRRSDASRDRGAVRLASGEATVLELAAPFDISLPAISRHLKVLENAGSHAGASA